MSETPDRPIENQPESEKLAALRKEVGEPQTEEVNENIDDKTLAEFLQQFPTDESQLRAISNIEIANIRNGYRFTVNFATNKNNEALEQDITAAIFPPEIREITVNDPEQGVLRGRRQGLKGQFYAENGRRLKIFTGTKVTINDLYNPDQLKTAELNIASGPNAKWQTQEGSQEREIEKYALEQGLDPEFLLSVRDDDGSFSTLLSISDRYDEIPPEQQLRMAAVVIGRMQSEFTEGRDPQPQIKDNSGKYTPEFAGHIYRRTWKKKAGEEKAEQKAIGYIGAEAAQREIKSFREPAVTANEEAVRSKLNFEKGRYDALSEKVKGMMAALAGAFPDARFISGVRSIAHNERVGGKPDSDHLHGLAFDTQCTPNNRARLVEMQQFINAQFGGDVFTLVHNPLHLHVSYRPGGRKLTGFPTVKGYGAGELQAFKQQVDQRLGA